MQDGDLIPARIWAIVATYSSFIGIYRGMNSQNFSNVTG